MFEEGPGALSANDQHTVNLTLMEISPEPPDDYRFTFRGFLYTPSFDTLEAGEKLHEEWERLMPAIDPTSSLPFPSDEPAAQDLSSDTSSVNVRAIGGGVVRSVAASILVCAAIFWHRRRVRARRTGKQNLFAKNKHMCLSNHERVKLFHLPTPMLQLQARLSGKNRISTTAHIRSRYDVHHNKQLQLLLTGSIPLMVTRMASQLRTSTVLQAPGPPKTAY